MRQMSSIASYSNFGDMATRPTLDLADRARGAGADGRCEGVLHQRRQRRRRHRRQARAPLLDPARRPSRSTIITRTRSYHGMHMAGTSLAGIPANREGYGPLDEGRARTWRGTTPRRSRRSSTSSAATRRRLLLRAGDRRRWCLPAAGRVPRSACARCAASAASCSSPTRSSRGYGRTGRMFASEGLEPDLVADRQGADVRLPADGRRARRGAGRRALLVDARIPVAPRLHVLGARERGSGRDGEPRHHRARGAGRAAWRACSSRSPRRWCRSARTRWWPTCAAASACSVP